MGDSFKKRRFRFDIIHLKFGRKAQLSIDLYGFMMRLITSLDISGLFDMRKVIYMYDAIVIGAVTPAVRRRLLYPGSIRKHCF